MVRSLALLMFRDEAQAAIDTSFNAGWMDKCCSNLHFNPSWFVHLRHHLEFKADIVTSTLRTCPLGHEIFTRVRPFLSS